MTPGELQEALNSGKATVQAPQASQPAPTSDAPSAAASSPAPAATPQASIDQFLPILIALQSTQQYLSAAPTFVPQTFQDQIQFVDDGTSKYIYVYFENAWQKVTLGTSSGPMWKAGQNNRNLRSAGSQVIAHGLGKIPTYVKITAWAGPFGSSTPYPWSTSIGSYDGTTNVCNGFLLNASNPYAGSALGQTANIIYLADINGNYLTATATVDAMNLTLTWVLTQPAPPMQNQSALFFWEVFG